ncbi:glycosyltransferase [Chloroflexota bacterium]
MHICMICQDFPPVARGAGYFAYNLSKRLIEQGHKVTVFTRGSWRKTYFEQIDGIFVHRVRFIPFSPTSPRILYK